jgi:ABC-type multidrug transport system ATPase subunit
MSSSSNTNGHLHIAVSEEDLKTMTKSNVDISKQDTITIHHKYITEVQMSVDGARIMADLSPHITVTFHNVSKVINIPGKMIDPTSKEKIVQRTLLDNVSGQVHPGQLVALMGPSGSGKTTLLNVLAGRALNGVTGNIWINNQRYEKGMKRKLAYVLQQDIFFENLTVKQQLTYTALLRLPNTLRRQDKLVQVEEIIEQLRLQNCANTPIMLISGGEKKRVNIATELLTNPSVIFLDG